MPDKKNQKVALITGSAGFIGYHVAKLLLDEGWRVIGLDCLSEYYDVSLKKSREAILLQHSSYRSIHKKLEEPGVLNKLFKEESPEIVIHLAAQAGVRFSIDNRKPFLESNILGTFELLEAAQEHPPEHLLFASTSSVYGANEDLPYRETHKADYQISFYAASKKSTEVIAHSYSHIYKLPITMFRFFTVYGPWGRPDMALFKFTNAILKGEKIDVYNNGNMRRDFTYIDDLVTGIRLLMDVKPNSPQASKIKNTRRADTDSSVAPFRIINIGNSKAKKLIDFISLLEKSLGRKAKKNFMPIQTGDVPTTWADTSALEKLTGFRPNTDISIGISNFVEWYKEYYKT